MLGRLISVDTGWQTVAAVQDLLEVKLGSGQAGFVTGFKVMQSSVETTTAIPKYQIQLKRATGSFTSGSGGTDISGSTAPLGSTGGVQSASTSQAAHGLATVERNNTTQAVVGSGTLTSWDADALNESSGVLDIAYIPEEWKPIGPSEAVILGLEEVPTSCTMRAIVKIILTHG